jgi:UDP:flavonoid glycosyltransferase YjiC (YdhE family)
VGKRIVLFTWGSFGDLHPYMAVARGLSARGHAPAICTSSVYRDKVTGAGLDFLPLRPDLPSLEDAPETAARVMESRNGTRYILTDLLMPFLDAMYEDAHAALDGADLAVTHAITYAAPMAADKRGVPWLSTALQPLVFTSAYDPPVPPQAPGLAFLRRLLPPTVMSRLIARGKADVLQWAPQLAPLRARLDLPPLANPLFDGMFSPRGTLALFSEVLGAPQPDWPAHTVQTGFPFYDRARDEDAALAPDLEAFLSAGGDPPVVFTLGTSAVMTAGAFFRESAEAARLLGRRAVLLIGKDPRNRPAPGALPPGVAAFEYAPYSLLLPRAAATVHQGGVGTTAQALRSGRPQLVVPFAHDQPDNADRVARLGVGGHLPRHAYTAARAAAALRRLLDDPACAARAADIGRRVQAEDGVGAACDAIERALSTGRLTSA